MKATEIKYTLLLSDLVTNPRATHAELAKSLYLPASLVNRYLKRLLAWEALGIGRGAAPHHLTRGSPKAWEALGIGRGAAREYRVAPKGDKLLWQGQWALLAYIGGVIERLHARTVEELRAEAGRHHWKTAALYGATPASSAVTSSSTLSSRSG